MASPLKNQPIEPTHSNVALALAELHKLGWIDGYWINNPRDYHILVTAGTDAVQLVTAQQVAIWIDGFITGKGGIEALA